MPCTAASCTPHRSALYTLYSVHARTHSDTGLAMHIPPLPVHRTVSIAQTSLAVASTSVKLAEGGVPRSTRHWRHRPGSTTPSQPLEGAHHAASHLTQARGAEQGAREALQLGEGGSGGEVRRLPWQRAAYLWWWKRHFVRAYPGGAGSSAGGAEGARSSGHLG